MKSPRNHKAVKHGWSKAEAARGGVGRVGVREHDGEVARRPLTLILGR